MNIASHKTVSLEKPEDFDLVEKLAEEAFGPGRFTRTAFRLREGVPHEPELSFVTWLSGKAIASVRLTKVWIGKDEALLLGPLVVSREFKSMGYGAELMFRAVEEAGKEGHSAIILVGDLPYYERFGFNQVPNGKMQLPGPVDPKRLLICPLNVSAAENLSGQVRPYS